MSQLPPVSSDSKVLTDAQSPVEVVVSPVTTAQQQATVANISMFMLEDQTSIPPIRGTATPSVLQHEVPRDLLHTQGVQPPATPQIPFVNRDRSPPQPMQAPAPVPIAHRFRSPPHLRGADEPHMPPPSPRGPGTDWEYKNGNWVKVSIRVDDRTGQRVSIPWTYNVTTEQWQPPIIQDAENSQGEPGRRAQRLATRPYTRTTPITRPGPIIIMDDDEIGNNGLAAIFARKAERYGLGKRTAISPQYAEYLQAQAASGEKPVPPSPRKKVAPPSYDPVSNQWI